MEECCRASARSYSAAKQRYKSWSTGGRLRGRIPVRSHALPSPRWLGEKGAKRIEGEATRTGSLLVLVAALWSARGRSRRRDPPILQWQQAQPDLAYCVSIGLADHEL